MPGCPPRACRRRWPSSPGRSTPPSTGSASSFKAEKLFTAAISHEVRTPLAIARLELDKIADPRARKVEKDLETLNRLVEQLTTLAPEVYGADLVARSRIEPLRLAENVVEALAPIVYDAGKSIELVDRGTPFAGHPDLVENALRNLVENAIRYSCAAAAIVVEVGPGQTFRVLDHGGAGPPDAPAGRAASAWSRPENRRPDRVDPWRRVLVRTRARRIGGHPQAIAEPLDGRLGSSICRLALLITDS